MPKVNFNVLNLSYIKSVTHSLFNKDLGYYFINTRYPHKITYRFWDCCIGEPKDYSRGVDAKSVDSKDLSLHRKNGEHSLKHHTKNSDLRGGFKSNSPSKPTYTTSTSSTPCASISSQTRDNFPSCGVGVNPTMRNYNSTNSGSEFNTYLANQSPVENFDVKSIDIKSRVKRNMSWILWEKYTNKYKSFSEFKGSWKSENKITDIIKRDVKGELDVAKHKVKLFNQTFNWFLGRRK